MEKGMGVKNWYKVVSSDVLTWCDDIQWIAMFPFMYWQNGCANHDLQNDFLRSVKFGIDFRTIIHSFHTFKYFIHWMIGEISRAFVEALATEIFTFLFCWKLYRQKINNSAEVVC